MLTGNPLKRERPLMLELMDLYVRRENQIVLRGLSIELEAGRFIGITGACGAGKTAIFEVILGILVPFMGTVSVAGRKIITPKDQNWVYSQITYVPQESLHSKIPITVKDAVLMGRWGKNFGFFHKPQSKDWQKINLALEKVGLDTKAKLDCRELTEGDLSKLAIARALVRETPILLMDEPTLCLDRHSRAEWVELLHLLRLEQELSIVISSQDPSHLDRIADQVLHLENGQFEEMP